MAAMGTLEQRHIVQSFIVFSKNFRLDGPNYISQIFTPRITKYNLRGSENEIANRKKVVRFCHAPMVR